MNKRSYIIISVLLVFGLCICGGCSARQGGKYTIEDLDNLAEIRIYSAGDNELIKTVRAPRRIGKSLRGGKGAIFLDFIQVPCCAFW